MRLWSIHPSYLDAKGLVASWREGLLAKKVLEGNTKGYTNHPQLLRFKTSTDPLGSINVYLEEVQEEASRRGYQFDASKIQLGVKVPRIAVTDGQLAYEIEHLKLKLQTRDPKRLNTLPKSTANTHSLFKTVQGKIEQWEVISEK